MQILINIIAYNCLISEEDDTAVKPVVSAPSVMRLRLKCFRGLNGFTGKPSANSYTWKHSSRIEVFSRYRWIRAGTRKEFLVRFGYSEVELADRNVFEFTSDLGPGLENNFWFSSKVMSNSTGILK